MLVRLLVIVEANFNFHYFIIIKESKTVVAFKFSANNLPVFELTPFSKQRRESAEMRKMRFSSHEVFQDKYQLYAADEAAVRRTFHDRVLLFFERFPGWCVESNGLWLLIYRHGESLKPQRWAFRLKESVQIFKVLSGL